MVRRAHYRTVALAAVLCMLTACGGDDSGGTATTTAPDGPDRPPGYVALGDSFSAGEGTGSYDEASGACHRSELSWPYLLDELGVGADDVQLMDHRACGGARIEHLLGPWADRDQPAQIPDEPDDTIGLVTFTIGGNDAGFSDIVARCVLSDCADVPGSAAFQASLDRIAERLVDEVYPALRAAYPEALLVQVGYPSLTPAVGEPLRDSCGWLSGAEQAAIPDIVASLDDTFSAAAEGEDDVVVVSAFDAFEGHELCTEDPWVNEVLSLDSGRAHPTTEGYRAIAESVATALAEAD